MAKNVFDDPKYVEETSNPFDSPDFVQEEESGPSVASELARGTGLAARSAITGAAAIPNMFLDFAYGLGGSITGQPTVLPSERLQRSLTSFGLPEPQSDIERVGQAVGGAATGAAALTKGAQLGARATTGTAQRVLENLGRDPMAQAGAAALGAGAGGLLAEAEAPPWAQVGGAVLAGTMVPTGGGTLASALARPYTVGGRERIAGDVLRQFATNPEQAAANLALYQPTVRGSVATAAQAARDPGLLGLERFIRGTPGAGGFAEDITRNNQARIAALNRIIGQGSEQTRRAKTGIIPVLEKSMAGKTDVSLEPVILRFEEMRNTPRFTDAYSRSAIDRATSEIQSLGNKAFDPEFLYNGPRKTIAEMVNKKFDPLGNRGLQANEIAAYKEILRSIDDAIETGAPGYSEYRKQYARLMRGAERRGTIEDMKAKTEANASVDLSGENVLQASRWFGALKKMDDEVARLSPMQKKTIQSISDDFKTGLLTGTGSPIGSSTWANINMGHLLGRIAGGGLGDDAPRWVKNVADKFAFMVKMPQEDVQRLIIDAMRDPDLARNLLVKANKMSAEPLSKKLTRRAAAYGYGAAQIED